MAVRKPYIGNGAFESMDFLGGPYFTFLALKKSDMFFSSQPASGEEVQSYYIGLPVCDLLTIAHPQGSLCIKEENNKNFIHGISFLHMLHYRRIMSVDKLPEQILKEKRKVMFGNFSPEQPLKVILHEPFGSRHTFEIKPYQHHLLDWLVLEYFPTGYVAWWVAKQIEQLLKEDLLQTKGGVSIEELYLDHFEVSGNLVSKICLKSLLHMQGTNKIFKSSTK